MMSTVPVSVVIPCFCCANTIERAVASIAYQTARPKEVILVNDASPDNTSQALTRVRDTYPVGWVSIVTQQQNQGAATSRNIGWGQATGEYVAFLDADDTWHAQKLALQYQYMHTRPDLVVTGHRFIHATAETNGFPALPSGVTPDRAIVPWRVLLKNPFITPSIMVKRDAPLRFPAGQRYMEDHLFLMQLALRGIPLSKIDLPLAAIHKHRYGQAGLSSDMLAMHQAEFANLRQLVRDGDISIWTSRALQIYVKLKFLRRKALVAARYYLDDPS